MRVPYNLAILSTHPIQYHAPWFRGLAAHPDLRVHVYFCHKATPQEQANAGFGVEFDWDVDLLEGYPHTFLKNEANPPGHGRFGGFDTPEFSRIIRSRKYDAVLVNGWNYKSAWQAIWAAWNAGVKVLARGDSHLNTERSALTRAAKLMTYRRFIPRFDACLAVGDWSRKYFLHYGARSNRIFSVPHIVDLPPVTGDETAIRHRFRKAADLDSNATIFIFCGKFIPKKRPMDFVKAVTRAAETGASIQGVMVGDGPLRNFCELSAQRERGPVKFAGFLNQSEIREAYVASDVLVLPSDGRETWGLVVNEAMSCGLPCIVSDRVGCGPDLVTPEQTGLIFPHGNVCALSASMVKMARNRMHLRQMGCAAQKRLQRYSLQAAVDGVVQALEFTLNAREAACVQ